MGELSVKSMFNHPRLCLSIFILPISCSNCSEERDRTCSESNTNTRAAAQCAMRNRPYLCTQTVEFETGANHVV